MNTEKEVKGAARILRQLDAYLKDLEKQKGATLKAKAKAVAIPEKRKKAFGAVIMLLSNWDKRLNEPKPADRYAKLPKALPPKPVDQKIRIISDEPRLNFVKDYY